MQRLNGVQQGLSLAVAQCKRVNPRLTEKTAE